MQQGLLATDVQQAGHVPLTWRATKFPAKSSCSEMGSTSGARRVMLDLRAIAATFISSRPILTPTLPSSSSFWITTLHTER